MNIYVDITDKRTGDERIYDDCDMSQGPNKVAVELYRTEYTQGTPGTRAMSCLSAGSGRAGYIIDIFMVCSASSRS